MDKQSGENFLKEIHNKIILYSHYYQIPNSLLSRVNKEYLGYLYNTDGKSFYYQWLAILVKTVKPNLILELVIVLG
jgi:hypothetical protein